MVLLGLMACSLFLVKLDVPLLEPEEARYAEIPRQMLEQGEFLTPVLHGEIYLHKPPLLYWQPGSVAVSVLAFFALSAAAAVAAYHLLEAPMVALGRRLTERDDARAAKPG